MRISFTKRSVVNEVAVAGGVSESGNAVTVAAAIKAAGNAEGQTAMLNEFITGLNATYSLGIPTDGSADFGVVMDMLATYISSL
jgi:hypothetical protein